MVKKVKVQKEVVNSIPLGVKILAILAYIGAAFSVLFGIITMIFSAGFGNFLNMIPGYSAIAAMGAGLFIVMGLVMIACGVLDYFIGRGLWNGRNWARILVLVLSVLSLLGAFNPFNLVGLIITAVIIWYLGFDKEAKAYFR